MHTLLFHREFHGYTGGHGKVLDYLRHTQMHADWAAQVYVTDTSTDTANNPFAVLQERTHTWSPRACDGIFLGGTDWLALPTDTTTPPVINLIQHVRHADPQGGLRRFLGRRAIRICVSSAVSDAISATGEVNGPLLTIPAAVDTAMLAALGEIAASNDVFVDAVKQPVLGEVIAAGLRAAGVDVTLHTVRCPRSDYLAHMAQAHVVVTLPDPAEGFYLPGLEAMAMGRALVQYDCVGSRDYLRDRHNALVTAASAADIIQAVHTLCEDIGLRRQLARGAVETALTFDLAGERAAFHAVLDELDILWRMAA